MINHILIVQIPANPGGRKHSFIVTVQGVLPTVYKIHNFRINSEREQAKEKVEEE
jgi:C4-type Zn-finger protein